MGTTHTGRILCCLIFMVRAGVSQAGEVFSDGFESGDTSAWSALSTCTDACFVAGANVCSGCEGRTVRLVWFSSTSGTCVSEFSVSYATCGESPMTTGFDAFRDGSP